MWTKLEPATDPIQLAPPDMVIAVGFGAAYVSRDGESVWEEHLQAEWETLWTVERAEQEAAKDPEHDWRIHRVGPLNEGHWQRQGVNRWVLYEVGDGFA